MNEHARENRWGWVMLTLGILLVIGGLVVMAMDLTLPKSTGQDVNTRSVDMQRMLVASDCVQQETLRYVRCGHEVIRRVHVPHAWIGLDYAQVEARLPRQTRIVQFSAEEIDTQKRIAMYCPQHWVVQTDAEGLLGVWVNRYGEEMVCAYPTTCRSAETDEEMQEKLRVGVAFDTQEEAEHFLKAHIGE